MFIVFLKTYSNILHFIFICFVLCGNDRFWIKYWQWAIHSSLFYTTTNVQQHQQQQTTLALYTKLCVYMYSIFINNMYSYKQTNLWLHPMPLPMLRTWHWMSAPSPTTMLSFEWMPWMDHSSLSPFQSFQHGILLMLGSMRNSQNESIDASKWSMFKFNECIWPYPGLPKELNTPQNIVGVSVVCKNNKQYVLYSK